MESVLRFGAIALVLASCQQDPTPLAGAMPAPPTAPRAPPAMTPARGDDLSGRVIETMNAGGYTYARIDHDGTKHWVAGPETKLAVGTSLGRMTGTLMTAFRSDTLARTFDQIYFINRYAVIEAGTPPNPHGVPPPVQPIGVTVEPLAPPPGGKPIGDVIANKSQLAGKTVVVRGKVVKVNNKILDRNWFHLRDGSGAVGSNDLLVTSQDTAKLGDVIVARGTVAIDKSFGATYNYDVLIEDAKLTGP